MPEFFATPLAFRRWLEQNHATQRELIVGFYVKASGKPSLTWPESVEEALCFGWIDGIRRKHGPDSYTIRFTPRKPASIWSRKNLATIGRLLKEGRVAPAGRKIYEARDRTKTGLYSFERDAAQFTPAQQAALKKNAKAAAFWHSQPPGYCKVATHWVTSAKQEATREKRLQILIECSANGLKIPPLRRASEKPK
jgi:uncharacterized protein YdeI (YjbR/CyaY-like superfamily)